MIRRTEIVAWDAHAGVVCVCICVEKLLVGEGAAATDVGTGRCEGRVSECTA